MRQQIREELLAITPMDACEREHIADALAWIDSGAELCRLAKPATPPKHLVAYVAVVDGDHILLVDHRNAMLWLPVGGHVEPGEHPRLTAVRELHEELAVTPAHELAAPLMVTCTTTVGHTAGHVDVSFWYVAHVPRRQALRFNNDEFNDARWFAFADVPQGRTDPHMARFLAKLASSNVAVGGL